VQLIGIVENALPILEVDGHVALTDYLDEPDLSPRAREALGRRLRGVRQLERPWWLAGYGAFSLIGGVALLAGSAWVWWLAFPCDGSAQQCLGPNHFRQRAVRRQTIRSCRQDSTSSVAA
jgi:hypothetical protein